MGIFSFQPNPQDLQAFQKEFKNKLSPSNNPYLAQFYRLDGATVSLYTSGKLVIQGNGADQYAHYFGQAEKKASLDQAKVSILGSDEVGNGSYLGGLTVVSALVTPNDQAWLRELGVGDSKQLTDTQIRKLAPLLKEALPHQALLLSPAKYNQVIDSGYNAVSVKVALHNQAHFLMLQKGISADKIVIDAFTSEKNYQKYLAQESNRFEQAVSLEEKAENKYLAVAVASIIARDLFLENLDQLGKELGMKLPSGAGTASDQVAARIIKRYGMDGLNQVAKLHFKNTEKALKIVKGKK